MPTALSHGLPLLTAAAGLALGWRLRGRRPLRPARTAPAAPLGPSDQQLREWIDAMAQGWLAIAPNDTIASANPRAESLLGGRYGLTHRSPIRIRRRLQICAVRLCNKIGRRGDKLGSALTRRFLLIYCNVRKKAKPCKWCYVVRTYGIPMQCDQLLSGVSCKAWQNAWLVHLCATA